MPVRHELHAGGQLYPDHVRTGLCRMTYYDGQASRRRERRERLPVDILGQYRPEDALIWLVGAHRHGLPARVTLTPMYLPRTVAHHASPATPVRACLTAYAPPGWLRRAVIAGATSRSHTSARGSRSLAPSSHSLRNTGSSSAETRESS